MKEGNLRKSGFKSRFQMQLVQLHLGDAESSAAARAAVASIRAALEAQSRALAALLCGAKERGELVPSLCRTAEGIADFAARRVGGYNRPL
jgi:hypothetical protein